MLNAVNPKEQKVKLKKNSAGNNENNKSGQKNSIPNKKNVHNSNDHNTNIRSDRKRRTVYPPCETCGRTNHSTKKFYFGAKLANRPPPWHKRPMGQNQNQQKGTQSNTNENFQAAAQTLNQNCHVFTTELQLTDRRPPQRQNFHQIPRLSCSNPRRHLLTTTS